MMHRATGLLKNSVLLFVAMMIGHLCNYLFQFFMGRHLSVADYGMMNALFSLLVITSVPAGTIQLVMAQNAARLAGGERSRLAALYLRALKWVSLGAMAGLGVFLTASGRIAAFLNTGSLVPVVLVGAALGVGLLVPVNMGVLQGLHRFGSFGANTILGAGLKLTSGMLLVYVGWGVDGALTSLCVAGVGTLIVSTFPLRALWKHMRSGRVESRGGETAALVVPAAAAAFCFMVLTNVDTVLVRHYFSAQETGMYAAAGVLGRVVLYAPGAIVLVLFPMTARSHALDKAPFPILYRGMLYAGSIAAAAAIVYAVFPEVLLGWLYGEKYAAAAQLLRLYGVAMVPPSLLAVVMHFNLARRRVGFLYSMALACVLEVVLIGMYHRQLEHVLWIVLGVGGALCCGNLAMIGCERAKSGAAPCSVQLEEREGGTRSRCCGSA